MDTRPTDFIAGANAFMGDKAPGDEPRSAAWLAGYRWMEEYVRMAPISSAAMDYAAGLSA